jgi:hypothetical protein
MLLFDLITEQTTTQPPGKLPGAGGVGLPAQVDTSGDAAKAVVAEPKPSAMTGKPQPTGPAQAQAQQANAQLGQTNAQPASNTTQLQNQQAELEERVMQRMQELAGMLRR